MQWISNQLIKPTIIELPVIVVKHAKKIKRATNTSGKEIKDRN